MVLTCFSTKSLFLTLICAVMTYVFYINIFGTTISWNSISVRNIFTQLVNVNVILKRNDIVPLDVNKTVLEVTQCYDRPLKPLIQQRGNFWVFYNYIRAENQHRCFESVTYTTQGDYTFLDNVIPLVERWKGPISVALHAPGDDFQPTLDSIAYLRNCRSFLIKQYVTFHLFFDRQHIPKNSSLKSLRETYEDNYNCSQNAPYKNKNYTVLYRRKVNLTYPINVARNIAKVTAQTHFVLPSDIELYPSPNLISKFLGMVARRKELFKDKTPKIFALPLFEVLANQSIPESKTVLQKMVKSQKAFSFHQNLCKKCHEIPNARHWLNLTETEDLNIFIAVKRQRIHEDWEPIYIGTHDDPLFDERLTWEGQSDKMTQVYTMCLLDYDYVVLDNAFLVHKPGLKRNKFQIQKLINIVQETNKLISTQIKTELHALYGTRERCKLQ